MSLSPSPHSTWLRWTSTVLAVLVPSLVLGFGVSWMEEQGDWTDDRETRNAGFVMNGKVYQAGVVETIERRLDSAKPEVIVLGNSLSNTDLHTTLLAKRLDLPKQKVQKFSIPNSIGSHWYAVLKNRVYANGYQPRLVVILSDLQSALAVHPRTEPAYLNLTVHLNEEEPVIDLRSGSRNYFFDRVRENRSSIQQQSLKYIRNLAVDALYWHQFNSERHKTNRALERAFDPSRTDVSLHHNVIPIYTSDRTLQPFDPTLLPRPEESYLEDITKLVSANGGTVLFLRPPMSPLLPPEAGDTVVPGTEGKVVALVAEHGGHYIDMRGLNMSLGHFYNVDHMNPEGARRFTEAVAQMIREIELTTPPKRRGRRRPYEMELFAAVQYENGQLTQYAPEVEYGSKPGNVPGAQRPFHRKRKDVAYYKSEGLGFLSDADSMNLSRFADRCSPLRVLEDGVALPLHNVACEELMEHGQGRVCHTRERVFFTAPDGSAPFLNKRKYKLALDPDRSCEAGTWVYPNDRLRLRIDPTNLDAMGRGARSVEIEAHDLGGGKEEGELTIRLRVNGEIRSEKSFVPSRDRGKTRLPIRPPIHGMSEDVVLAITNESDRFILVTSASLSERPPSSSPQGPNSSSSSSGASPSSSSER